MAAAAANKTVVLESFYLNHRFPKYGIAFRNGRCLVSADQLVELKGKKEYGRDFAELGKLRVRRPQPVLVTRGSTTTVRYPSVRAMEQRGMATCTAPTTTSTGGAS